MNLNGTREISTDRLILRRIRLSDAEDMFNNWASSENVTRYLTWKAHKDIEATKQVIAFWVSEYMKEDCFRWCIAFKETGEVIGCIDVVKLDTSLECAAIGYCMSEKYWNRGIMTESLTRVIEFLFTEVGVNRVEASHHTGNTPSGKVMQKSGMVFEGVRRMGARDNKGCLCDLATYAILKDEFINKGNMVNVDQP